MLILFLKNKNILGCFLWVIDYELIWGMIVIDG